MLKRILRSGGVFSAPWLYGMGRLFKSRRFMSFVLRGDPLYTRAKLERMRMDGRPTDAAGQFMMAVDIAASTTPAASLQIKDMLSKSHGQLLQDIVCMLVHDVKSNGYFVEVGVGNGKDISNTYMLEKQHEWDGLLVEPSKGFHKLIKSSRKARLDTRAATAAGGEEVQFEEYPNAGEFSKLASVEGYSPDTNAVKKYLVKTATLNDILLENNAPTQIDYMSIDTEGTEIDILKGLDLNKYTIGFFSIEHNFRAGDLSALKAALELHGYRQILSEISCFDAWFVHSSVNLSCVLEA